MMFQGIGFTPTALPNAQEKTKDVFSKNASSPQDPFLPGNGQNEPLMLVLPFVTPRMHFKCVLVIGIARMEPLP
jgi:hypothetical protein